MEEFWILILVAFFTTNSLKKAESVKLELKTFDEIFGEGWWDKGEAAEDLKTPAPTNFGQNVHHQIDRQNTEIGQIEPNSTDHLGQIEPNSTDHLGQIEPNSTDQLGQIEPNSTDHLGQIEPNSTDQLGQIEPNLTDQLGQIEPNSTDQLGQIEPNLTDQLGQIEPNSTDQNPPLTESDHCGQIKPNAEDERKRKIIDKFHAMKDEFKQKGKNTTKEWNQIEEEIAKDLKVSRKKIYKWKKEFGLSRKVFYEKEEHKHLVEKFDQRKAELKRDGFKNSYKHEIDETVAKELGLNFKTIYAWKSELGQTKPNHKHSHSEQKELIKRYYEIKDQNPKSIDKDIAKMLKIGSATLDRWKRQFIRQHFI
uniref:Transposase n=1 Tax=Globodera rostochiensis TaxID=31243 RepID=A0A914HS87_GLORO